MWAIRVFFASGGRTPRSFAALRMTLQIKIRIDGEGRVAEELAEGADVGGEFEGAAGGFATPEGNGGRLAVSVFDEDASGFGFDAVDAPTGVAEKHDVASVRFDGEVFVERADDGFFGKSDDGEERGFGDSSAGGDGGEAGATAGAQAVVDLVAIEIGPVASTLGADAFAEHDENFVEGLAGEVAVVAGAADEGEEFVFVPFVGGAGGDDLLGEDVERAVGEDEVIEIGLADGADDGGALDEFVASGGEEASLGDSSTPVPRTSDALQCDGDGAGRADLADEIDVADVDAEFEGSGGDEDAALALLEAALGFEAEVAGEGAVVGGYRVLAHALGEVVGDAFDEASGVDEDESGAVFDGELLEALVDFVPHFVGGDGAELGGGELDGEVERAGRRDEDGDGGGVC